MRYKVTALQDVMLRAYVPTQKLTTHGNERIVVPSEKEEWVSLRAGECRENLGMILGVHPDYLPSETPLHVQGSPPMICAPSTADSDLPKEFFGLYRLELQE
jgi:hypothetical protein